MDTKPIITELEADRQVAVAGIQAEQAALRSGADPQAVDALMKTTTGSPVVCGFKLEGVQDGGMTMGCLMAIMAMEQKFKPASPMEAIVAGLLCFIDPAKAYNSVSGDDMASFTGLVNDTIWQRKVTIKELRLIDATIKKYMAGAPGDEDENFQKPVTETAPAT